MEHPTDALTLIGDGQQSIYPGGYTIGELGISIAGRGVVMTRKYRNTRNAPRRHRGACSLRTRDVTACVRVLTSAGVPVVELASYDGRVARGVRVGTVKRAKGLEHKDVLVARIPARMVSRQIAERDAADRVEIERRQLYVAMTRAREVLWVGVVS